jgi:hypothetical protein
MTSGQFRRGLSGGVRVLAIAGCFWFGISFGVITYSWGLWPWGISTAIQFGMVSAIFWASARLRLKSEASATETPRSQRVETQRITQIFIGIVSIQALLIAGAVYWCIRIGAKDLIWPSIGLIVSAHFAPLARLFHVRAYYATALAGVAISMSAFIGITNIHQLWFGGSMAAVMWSSAWYLIKNADQITRRTLTSW